MYSLITNIQIYNNGWYRLNNLWNKYFYKIKNSLITRIKIQFRRRIQIDDLFIIIITIFLFSLLPKFQLSLRCSFSHFFSIYVAIYIYTIYIYIYITQSVLHNIYFHTSLLYLKYFVYLSTNVTYDTYTQTHVYIIHTQTYSLYTYSEINFFGKNFNRSRFTRKINWLEILKFIINCSIKKNRYFA